jgi:hypothetical protein
MRFNKGKAMPYWLAGAATLLFASAQPAWAKCQAEKWVSDVDVTIDYTDYADHVPLRAKFELKKRFWVCGLKMEPVKSLHPEFDSLSFDCEWDGAAATQKEVGKPGNWTSLVTKPTDPPWWIGHPHCVSTRWLRLHQENGVPKKHRVVLIPYDADDDDKRRFHIYLLDEAKIRHAGVAHGTGDD